MPEHCMFCCPLCPSVCLSVCFSTFDWVAYLIWNRIQLRIPIRFLSDELINSSPGNCVTCASLHLPRLKLINNCHLFSFFTINTSSTDRLTVQRLFTVNTSNMQIILWLETLIIQKEWKYISVLSTLKELYKSKYRKWVAELKRNAL